MRTTPRGNAGVGPALASTPSQHQALLTGLRDVHRALLDLHGDVRRSLALQEDDGIELAGDPPIHLVIEQGEVKGPFCGSELARWRGLEVNLLFDTTLNQLSIRGPEDGDARVVPLGPHVQQTELSSVLALLQLLAEHPGKRFTEQIVAEYLRQATLERNTFAKYIRRIRQRIGDTHAHRFILTDEGVAPGVSRTGCAYYANPDLRWRVIKYLPDLVSPTFPSGRPSTG